MDSLVAIGFLLGLASVLAAVLAVANSKLQVFEDPRIDAVYDLLPHTNCGACGMPGCRAFAEKAVAGEIQPSRCTVGGPETAARVAEYLGVEAGTLDRLVARLLCAGGKDVAIQMAEYRGYPSCRAAVAAGGGSKGCRYGCLGFGDCKSVCEFDAITMGPTGLPVVDFEKCTACGDCVRICPKNLFELIPVRQHILVQCKSELAGGGVRKLCKVACTACARCVADAPQGFLKMKKNLPVLNPDLLHMQSPEVVRRCPTSAIVWVDDQQFHKEWPNGNKAPDAPADSL